MFANQYQVLQQKQLKAKSERSFKIKKYKSLQDQIQKEREESLKIVQQLQEKTKLSFSEQYTSSKISINKNTFVTHNGNPKSYQFASLDQPVNLKKDFSYAFKFTKGNYNLAGIGLCDLVTRSNLDFELKSNGNYFKYVHQDIVIDKTKEIVHLKKKSKSTNKIALANNPLVQREDQQDLIFNFTIIQANTKSNLAIGIMNKQKCEQFKYSFNSEYNNHGAYMINMNGIQYSNIQSQNNTIAQKIEKKEKQEGENSDDEENIQDEIQQQMTDRSGEENQSNNRIPTDLQHSIVQQGDQKLQMSMLTTQQNENSPMNGNENTQQQQKIVKKFKMYHQSSIQCIVSFKNHTITYINKYDKSKFVQQFNYNSQDQYYIGCVLTNSQDIVKIKEVPQFGNGTYLLTSQGYSIKCEGKKQIIDNKVTFDIKQSDIIFLNYSAEDNTLIFKKDSTFQQYEMIIKPDQTLFLTCMLYNPQEEIQFIEFVDHIQHYRDDYYRYKSEQSKKILKQRQVDEVEINTNEKRMQEFEALKKKMQQLKGNNKASKSVDITPKTQFLKPSKTSNLQNRLRLNVYTSQSISNTPNHSKYTNAKSAKLSMNASPQLTNQNFQQMNQELRKKDEEELKKEQQKIDRVMENSKKIRISKFDDNKLQYSQILKKKNQLYNMAQEKPRKKVSYQY